MFCRRETNQIAAQKLWPEISDNLSPEDKVCFKIEWNHYMIGDATHEEFGCYVKELEAKLKI